MNRVRVKICGVTSVADALAAVAAGADALGFVFFKQSSRALTAQQAQEISQQLPPFVTRVALFLDADAVEVMQTLRHFRPDMLQFHGQETPEYCRQFKLPYMKAVAMGDGGADLAQWQRQYHDASALLLDAHTAGQAGGKGETFDWQAHADLPDMPIVIAGGLNPDNAGAAVRHFKPYAVDVSSGVESAPGQKDHTKMHAFVDAVMTASN